MSCAVSNRVWAYDSHPVRSYTSFWAAGEAREFEQAEIKKVLTTSIIEPTQMNWEAAVMFVPKMHDSLQFCIDELDLNSVTFSYSYARHKMVQCIDYPRDAITF